MILGFARRFLPGFGNYEGGTSEKGTNRRARRYEHDFVSVDRRQSVTLIFRLEKKTSVFPDPHHMMR